MRSENAALLATQQKPRGVIAHNVVMNNSTMAILSETAAPVKSYHTFGEKVKNALCKFLGIRQITNREAILMELAEMHGYDFFVHTGLVFNEDIIADKGSLSYEEWLDETAHMSNFFKGSNHP